MKRKINALIVVEGKTDIDFLSSFLDTDFYSVNGSAINNKDIDFLNNVSLTRKIIILTDPDYPGQKIRDTINKNVKNNIYNAYVRKEFSIKNHKVGVAESTINEVNYALDNLVEYNDENIEKSDLKLNDLYELGIIGNENSSILRNKLDDYYHLGHSNGKQLLNKLRFLGINKDKLMEILKNVK